MRSIEFVRYNGRYPTLCSGWLELKVDGEPWKRYVYLFSGGQCYIDENSDEVVTEGPWDLSKGEYDKFVKDGFDDAEIDEIIRLVNENVEHGCCGGCI